MPSTQIMMEHIAPAKAPSGRQTAFSDRAVAVAASIEVQHYLQTALDALGYRAELADGEGELLARIASVHDVFAVLVEDAFASGKVISQICKRKEPGADCLPVGIITVDGADPALCGNLPAGDTVIQFHDPIFGADLKHIMQTLSEARRRLSDAPRNAALAAPFPADSSNLHVRRISRLIDQAALCDVPVLVQGETGVGKETVVRAIHERSARARQPFVNVNCAALPRELVESQLFGYERGAFTGAYRNQPGLFEIANGGTILLDEIGDMDIRLQAKLLQVLQDQEFHPLGSSMSIRVNVRVMAATHRDLREAMRQGRLREDLYYRLNVVSITIPPLRERRDEILPLADFLLRKHATGEDPAPELDAETKVLLLSHRWPGNVRELENTMRRYLVLRDRSVFDELRGAVEPGHTASGDAEAAPAPGAPHVPSIFETLDHAKNKAQVEALVSALIAAQWNRRKAANLLRVDYKALLYQMKKFQIGAARQGIAAKNGTKDQMDVTSGSAVLATS